MQQTQDNLKQWMDDPQNVYIGRANIVFIDNQRFPKQASPFCNPFKIDKDTSIDAVCDKFKSFMKERLDKDKDLVKQLTSLKGKRLGCWCKPEKCHGDVLVELIDEYCE
jgi:hypothetical protein